MHIVRAKLKQSVGMTMAEMLIVVAIIGVLSGVAFISVFAYQRTMGQLERDGIAKEIFVAAQNHLTAAYGEGYLSTSSYGTPDTADRDNNNKVYYIAVNQGVASEDAMFDLMLPFGAIDETVRAGGSYIIRYQPETATVLDVFYCSTSGSPERFNHSLSSEDYANVVNLTGDGQEEKAARRNGDWDDGAILGWYGGELASALPNLTLKAPTIEVVNADKLIVKVTDQNSDKNEAMLQLIVEGVSSGAKKAIGLSSTATGRVTYDSAQYTIVLDDITSSDMHFTELGADTGAFVPGENIKIQAVAYSTTALANIAYSGEKTTNSLFADGTTAETAYIASIRHLENLDKKVSNLDANDTDKLNIEDAVQTTDLNWTTFKEQTNPNSPDSTSIYLYSSTGVITTVPNYYPISPDYALTYDGQSHSISNITANADNAGLFGDTSSVTSISNLELIDFSITGTSTAGALAGTLTGTTVTNVLARNSSGIQTTDTRVITASSGDAGGLVGSMNGTVQASAASLVVSGTTTAGGLIGTASGTIEGCYSGGHTTGGAYSSDSYNVTATSGTAGGLVGSYTGSSRITYSYSTCSVSGGTCGGFVGRATDATISYCYCTGLVSGDNAFIGDGTLSGEGNYYYEIVNEVLTKDASGNVTAVTYKESGSDSDKVTAFDSDTVTYNDFVGSSSDWKSAKAYDTDLNKYYAGKYNLQTIEQRYGETPPTYDADGDEIRDYTSWSDLFVSTHYGDWPSPETFFINTR